MYQVSDLYLNVHSLHILESISYHIYIYISQLYSNYECFLFNTFGILTACFQALKLIWIWKVLSLHVNPPWIPLDQDLYLLVAHCLFCKTHEKRIIWHVYALMWHIVSKEYKQVLINTIWYIISHKQSRKLKVREKDINKIGKGLIAYIPHICTRMMYGKIEEFRGYRWKEHDVCAQVWHHVKRGNSIWEGPITDPLFLGTISEHQCPSLTLLSFI